MRQRADAVGVTRLLVIGWDQASSRRAVEMTVEDGLFAAVGIHPESAHEWNDEVSDDLRGLCRANETVAAWGEIGLDYHWETVPRARQQAVFAAQIAAARAVSPALPLVIHNRDALDDILAVLREVAAPNPVVMHCFTGDSEDARRCLDAGCFLGVGGVTTFKKSDALRAALASAPLNRLLLETDCPYLAPQIVRGKRNEPSFLPAVAQTLATVQNLPIETIAAQTTANARLLLGV